MDMEIQKRKGTQMAQQTQPTNRILTVPNAMSAARILIDTTSGPQPPEPVTLRLGTKLVVRESCGCRG